mmetsp:Transcript_6215/g.14630  ORF Transcript_6215/g.14630 Transcript_6215/m.14630 type:complete len:216 (-) Transcript_6215:1129-1776(-)
MPRGFTNQHLSHFLCELQRTGGVGDILFVRAHARDDDHLGVGFQAVAQNVRDGRMPVRHRPLVLAPRQDDFPHRVQRLVRVPPVFQWLVLRRRSLGRRGSSSHGALHSDVGRSEIDELHPSGCRGTRGKVLRGDLEGCNNVAFQLIRARVRHVLFGKPTGTLCQALCPNAKNVVEGRKLDRYHTTNNCFSIAVGFNLQLGPRRRKRIGPHRFLGV